MKKLMCVLLMVFGLAISYLNAEEIDFGTYRVDLNASEGWRPKILLPDGQAIINVIFPQILLPGGPEGKKHSYESFTFEQPVLKKQNGVLLVNGKGLFKKTLTVEEMNVEAMIGMNYKLTFLSEGKLNMIYEFTNNGDDIFLEPFLNTRLNYDFLKNQQWKVKKVEGKEQGGVWPEEIVYGVNSVDASSGTVVELQILSATLDTSLGKPLIYKPSKQTHLRVSGDGVVSFYNFAHFAGEWTVYNWKTFKAKETFSIEAEILLPVKPGALKTAP